MATLRKAKKLSLVQDVVLQIENAIVDREYKPGDRLPSTRELQEILGASLGTIRESLAILEQKGLLEVRKGAKGGFFVKEITTKPIAESLELLMRHMSLSIQELFEFRATVEAGIVRLVVKRADEKQLQVVLSYLDKFKACLNNGLEGWLKLVETEQDIRKEFLKIIQNRTYAAVLLPINNSLLKLARHSLPGGSKETQIAYDYWSKIIPAIAARDEDCAASLIKELLYHFMELIKKNSKK